MSRQDIKPCLEKHLVDKAKSATVVPPGDWFASAQRHVDSANTIINSDPSGALQLAWSAMHDIAKGLAAMIGMRLDGETHGKIADFLGCVLGDQLTDTERGLIHRVRGGRNDSSYADPNVSQSPLIGGAVNLARKLVALAMAMLTPPPPADPSA